jgi:hypothetical protein
MWSLGVSLLKLHTGKDLFDHLDLGHEDANDNSHNPIVTFYLTHSDDDIQTHIQSILDTQLAHNEQRHIRSLLKKLLTTNVITNEQLEAKIDQKVHELFGEDGSTLKDLLLKIVRLDISNNDDLVVSLNQFVDSMLAANEAMEIKLFLKEVIQLRDTRRLSIAQVASHAYYTNLSGTTTMMNGSHMIDVKETLSQLCTELADLKITIEDVRDDLDDILGNQEQMKQSVEQLKVELNAKMMSGQMAPEDMMTFTQHMVSLNNNPSSEQLREIQEQLQAIYDRLNQA